MSIRVELSEFMESNRHFRNIARNLWNDRNLRNHMQINHLRHHTFILQSVNAFIAKRPSVQDWLISHRAEKKGKGNRLWETFTSFRNLRSHFPKQGKKRFFTGFNYAPVHCNRLQFHSFQIFQTMLYYIFALLWAAACSNHTGATTHDNGTKVSTVSQDTEGETGNIPPKPPIPPKP